MNMYLIKKLKVITSFRRINSVVEEGGHFLEEEGFVSFSELQEKCKIYDTIMLERKSIK